MILKELENIICQYIKGSPNDNFVPNIEATGPQSAIIDS
jgi:hypothetical protein